MSSTSPAPAGRVVTDAEVVELLRDAVLASGSQRAFARAARLHESDLSQVLRGRRAPTAGQCRAVSVHRALVLTQAPAGEAASCS